MPGIGFDAFFLRRWKNVLKTGHFLFFPKFAREFTASNDVIVP
jgi:hypothetical protein